MRRNIVMTGADSGAPADPDGAHEFAARFCGRVAGRRVPS